MSLPAFGRRRTTLALVALSGERAAPELLSTLREAEAAGLDPIDLGLARGHLSPHDVSAAVQTEERFGPFLVGPELGRGARGVVYRARHLESGTPCALKLLRSGPGEAAEDSFLRELSALQRLSAPGVARLLASGREGDTLFQATELVEGETLAEWVERAGPRPTAEAVALVRAIATTLEAVHAAGVIHRDLTPRNLMREPSGAPRVIDFGLAKAPARPVLTLGGVFLGTALYAAPEQLRDAASVDARADVYALGGVLHFLLTGRAPYPVRTFDELLRAHEERSLPTLGAEIEGHGRLNEILARALAREPGARHPDMKAFGASLERLAARLTPASSAETAATPPPPPVPGGQPVGPGGRLGPYAIERELGSGAMGVVYLATDTRLDRQVALKVLPRGGDDWRFEEEALAGAALRHPNLVIVFEQGESEGRRFLAMEYVAGSNLEDRLREGPLAPEEAARLVAQLARGMQHAHERGVIHRDLKPANVLIDARGTPKITDYGIARRIDRQTLTRSGALVGTPVYMARELFEGRANAASDVYALGVILFELLTGELPFTGASMIELVGKISSGRAPSPATLRPGLPRSLCEICLRATDPDPEARYASAQALAEALEALREGSEERASGALFVALGLGTTALLALALLWPRGAHPPRTSTPRATLSSTPTPTPSGPTPSPASPRQPELELARPSGLTWVLPPAARRFEGRDLAHEIGRASSAGWAADPEEGDASGLLCHGPQARPARRRARLSAGNYVAIYRLRIDRLKKEGPETQGVSHDAVVRLEVRAGEEVLAEREVLRIDFAQAETFQDFLLAFRLEDTRRVDLRLHWFGHARIEQDYVAIAPAPAEPEGEAILRASYPGATVAPEALSHLTGHAAQPRGWAVDLGDRRNVLAHGLFSDSLPPGRHEARFRVAVTEERSELATLDYKVVHLEIVDVTWGRLLAKHDVHRSELGQGSGEVVVPFALPTRRCLDLRVQWEGHAGVRLGPIRLVPASR